MTDSAGIGTVAAADPLPWLAACSPTARHRTVATRARAVAAPAVGSSAEGLAVGKFVDLEGHYDPGAALHRHADRVRLWAVATTVSTESRPVTSSACTTGWLSAMMMISDPASEARRAASTNTDSPAEPRKSTPGEVDEYGAGDLQLCGGDRVGERRCRHHVNGSDHADRRCIPLDRGRHPEAGLPRRRRGRSRRSLSHVPPPPVRCSSHRTALGAAVRTPSPHLSQRPEHLVTRSFSNGESTIR